MCQRLLEGRLQHLGEMEAIDLAGQAVEPRQIGEPLLLVVALVDDADDAVRPRRLAVAPANQRPISSIHSSCRRRPDAARIAPGKARRNRHRAPAISSPRRTGWLPLRRRAAWRSCARSKSWRGRRPSAPRSHWRPTPARRCRSTTRRQPPPTDAMIAAGSNACAAAEPAQRLERRAARPGEHVRRGRARAWRTRRSSGAGRARDRLDPGSHIRTFLGTPRCLDRDIAASNPGRSYRRTFK